MNFNKIFDSVVSEARLATSNNDSEAYNFLKGANQQLRRLEEKEDLEIYTNALISYLGSIKADEPAARHLLGSLFRIIDIDCMVTSYYTMRKNGIKDKDIEASIYPAGFLSVLSRFTGSKTIDVACTALQCCSKVGASSTTQACLKIAVDKKATTDIRSAAILAVTDSPLLTKAEGLVIRDLYYASRNKKLRLRCFDVFFQRPELINELETKILTKNKTLFQNPKYLRTLLDLGTKNHSKRISKTFASLPLKSLDDTIHRRLVRNPFVSKTIKKEAKKLIDFKLSHYPTRCNDADIDTPIAHDKRIGLIMHRNSTGIFVGHAALFIGDIDGDGKDVIEVGTTGFGTDAARRISFADYLSGGAFWGFREDAEHQVDIRGVIDRALDICSWRTKYDGMHNNQKGKWFKKCVERNLIGWCTKKVNNYWEADCVGFTERVYEDNHGNPTPSEYESGWGWPLTVREQRDHMRLVST